MTFHQALAINNYPKNNDKINHNEKAIDKKKGQVVGSSGVF